MITTIVLLQRAGEFAENKDIARAIRTGEIEPAVANGERVVIDFRGVNLATQSFIHALLSETIRIDGGSALALLEFKGCNPSVKNLVEIVSTYSQETVGDE